MMRPFTSKEIQDQFEKLPKELQGVVTSPEIHDKIEAIGKKYTLMIDQLGELVDEIGLILLGLTKSSDFVSHAMQRLNISSKTATLIAQDVNSEIFDSIKDSLRKIEAESVTEEPVIVAENRNQEVSSLERLGDFSIEKEAVEGANGVTAADRSNILAGLENPPASVPSHTTHPPTNLPTDGKSANMPSAAPISPASRTHSEPLVDYLLNNPAGQSAQQVTVTPTITPMSVPQSKISAIPPSKPSTGPDPYREAVK